MKKLAARSKTKKALARLTELHQASELFASNGSIREDPEVRSAVRDAVREFGLDLKRHAGIEGEAGISGEILYNMMAVVRACGSCVCHVGLYDFDTGTSSYLGYYYSGMCA